MTRSNLTLTALTVLIAFAAVSPAHAVMRITEWMYKGAGGEFMEFTNVGDTAIDMTGWSYDDESDNPGVFDLSGFGIVAAGESVVITEDSAATFRAAWNLDASVKVLGGVSNNIGRGDTINIYDGSDSLVDTLTYGDDDFPGTPRTDGVSANIPPDALGADDVYSVVVSTPGDIYGSFVNNNGDLGNPGSYVPVPEPASIAALAGGLLVLARRRRA